MKIKEINRTSTIAWSPDVIPLLATGSVAGAVDLDFTSSSTLEIWDVFGPLPNSPVFSATVENKFHALAWSRPFEGHSRGVLVGAYENGTLQFWDIETLIRTMSLSDASIYTSTKHSGAVKCLSFNSHQPHVLASGGQHSEIFIWDLKSFAEPISPGRPTTPMDEISCIAWNNAVSHILASTSNAGYTSIWDLKAKREVLHLAYTGTLGRADFSHVTWHPTQSTKLATASQSDACPLIMTWDLRNATEPEKILQGHTKGVLSIDWCLQDPNLLISSGKDNSTRLWNPVTGVKLGDYPTAANWSFLTRFAPRAPDVIASASFDGKVIVQTLQETSKPATEKVAEKNDDDFWSAIASSETQQAVFEVSQAPQWLKRPCSASFGFGSKLISVSNSSGKGSVKVSTFNTGSSDPEFAASLSAAIKSNDFHSIITSKLENQTVDHEDWEALSKLETSGKNQFLQAIIGDSLVAEEVKPHLESSNTDDQPADDTEESFFANLSKDIKSHKGLDQEPPYVPSGEFSIIDDSQPANNTRLTKLLLSNRISEAVSVCLEEGKLLEALVLSMDESEAVKSKVKGHFYEQTKSNVLSRLIYSASSKDVVDIVSNADISNWREIAASIAAYCEEESDFNSKSIELGDRIIASGSSDPEKRKNALSCYLAGNALDKVSAIWLSEIPNLEHQILTSSHATDKVATPYEAKFLALGDFVEKLSVYRSLSNQSGPLSGPSIEPVCRAVFDFASMSSLDGSFELANYLLTLLPEDFAGLNAEKERIAKATKTVPEASKTSVNGGVAKSQHRYTNMRAATNIPPAQFQQPKRPSVGRVPSQVAPLAAKTAVPAAKSSVYAPPGGITSNAYIPANDVRRESFSSSFPPVNNPMGFVTNPVSQAPHTGPVRPPPMPAFTQAYQQPQTYQNEAPGAVPVPNAAPGVNYKQDTEGWNDLPEAFKASKPPSRRAPAPAAVVAPSPSLSAVQVPQAQPPKRPQVSQLIAPPPKVGNRTASKSSAPGTPRISSPARSSRYAPPVPESPASQPNGFPSNGVLSPVQAPKVALPVKNPYAPAVVAPAKTTYATPPTNNFVAPPAPALSRTSTQVNPYSPGGRAGSRSVSNGSFSGPPSSGIVPPPRVPSISARQTPVQPSEPQFAPPPRAAASRYASPNVSQSNAFANGGPPVVPAATQIAPSPRLAASQVPPAPPPISAVQHRRTSSLASVTRIAQPPAVAPPPISKVSAPKADVDVQTQSNEHIKSSFGAILGQIKPAAPPKYAKHVVDMEKRLSILFEHLSKQTLLSAPTIGLLNQITSALSEKNYSKAAALNQQIAQDSPAEAGDWHTGVKRLITMAEAFDV